MSLIMSGVTKREDSVKQNELYCNLVFDFIRDMANEQVIYPETEKPIVKHMKVHQLSCVKDGQGWAYINGHINRIQKGDIVYIQREEEHSFFTFDQLSLLHVYWPLADFSEEDRTIIKEELDLAMFREIFL